MPCGCLGTEWAFLKGDLSGDCPPHLCVPASDPGSDTCGHTEYTQPMTPGALLLTKDKHNEEYLT